MLYVLYDVPAPAKTKLLDQVQEVLRVKHYSYRTEEAYLGWIKKYILFHNKRHPSEMGAREVNQYLSHLAVQHKVAASTQNQALCAILFLYREILQQDLGDLSAGPVWAKKPKRLPEVFTPSEVRAVLRQLSGPYWLA